MKTCCVRLCRLLTPHGSPCPPPPTNRREQRGMGRQSNGGGGASGANNGGNPNAAGDMATLGSLNFPGLSTGLSGLSFM